MTATTPWLLLDTATTGFSAPTFAVRIAAQRLLGWEREGEPFRRLLNHGCEIQAEAVRVNEFTREILERDGSSPAEVYGNYGRLRKDSWRSRPCATSPSVLSTSFRIAVKPLRRNHTPSFRPSFGNLGSPQPG